MTRSLFALFLATFAIATTEFAVVGLLPEISADLGASIPLTGLLVTGYAIGVALGSPFLALGTARISRKSALLVLMGIFVFGHLLSAVAFSYPFLMISRIITSVCHASFLGIAAVVAANSVPASMSQRAVARVWLGFSAGSLVGVPAGTALGQMLGWRATFWALAVTGVVSFAAIAAWVPSGERQTAATLVGEFRVLRRPQVLLAMVISLLVCATTFSVFTYIAPLLRSETNLAAGSIPHMLLLFGLGGTLGLLFAGRYPHLPQLPSVAAMMLAQGVVFLVFWLWLDNAVVAGGAMIAWGFLFLAPCVPLQTRVVQQAAGAPNLASTLNQSAFNVGNAIGPSLGAAALSAGLGYFSLPLIGLALALIGVVLTLATIRSDTKARPLAKDLA